MIINFMPQGNDRLTLESLSKQGDTLIINGTPYDLSIIPDGATLPNATEATGCDFIRGKIERINGELHVTLLLPHGPLPQPQSVLFPEPAHVTQDGPIDMPGADDAH